MSNDWWRGAVFYQIYPRSFQDTNHDGIGDLPGITQRMAYVARLGVDAIWVSPFFKSPMRDFGYDVEDYRQVDPLFGTLADFDELVQAAHRQGLKVLVDMVLSHTSDRHAWFEESRRSRDNAHADWYVWADARSDGMPPNNWLSMFGGVAWSWEPRREQYYLHNFLPSQPDLNLHNPEVQDAMLAECQFWLDRGVDGFRLDACNFLTHDRQLRDNPPRPPGHPPTDAVKPGNPYNFQLHVHDKSQPQTVDFLRRLRELAEKYSDIVLLAEIADDDSIARIAEYAGPGGPLHTGYSFALLGDTLDLHVLRQNLEAFMDEERQGWPAWAFSNHDVARVITRWGGQQAPAAFARALLFLLLSLRGTVFLYQGEELGLSEVDVPYSGIVDPYGLTFYPEFKGRDGCRTPMPWSDTDPLAHFTDVEPWLPIPNDHIAHCVAAQEADSDSVLHFTRRMVALRKARPALRRGRIEFQYVSERQVSFLRRSDAETLLIAVNLAEENVTLPWQGGALTPLDDVCVGAEVAEGAITLGPYGALAAQVTG
ncbi:alpha-glucosidase family protein [Pelagibius sp. 7325]|uniref:alpha-glucosidase family protein n=1 Tax=Pelagibius sp. 7325 TaxID=3131994 RepID=UPI0030EDAC90